MESLTSAEMREIFYISTIGQSFPLLWFNRQQNFLIRAKLKDQCQWKLWKELLFANKKEHCPQKLRISKIEPQIQIGLSSNAMLIFSSIPRTSKLSHTIEARENDISRSTVCTNGSWKIEECHKTYPTANY